MRRGKGRGRWKQGGRNKVWTIGAAAKAKAHTSLKNDVDGTSGPPPGSSGLSQAPERRKRLGDLRRQLAHVGSQLQRVQRSGHSVGKKPVNVNDIQQLKLKSIQSGDTPRGTGIEPPAFHSAASAGPAGSTAAQPSFRNRYRRFISKSGNHRLTLDTRSNLEKLRSLQLRFAALRERQMLAKAAAQRKKRKLKQKNLQAQIAAVKQQLQMVQQNRRRALILSSRAALARDKATRVRAYFAAPVGSRDMKLLRQNTPASQWRHRRSVRSLSVVSGGVAVRRTPQRTACVAPKGTSVSRAAPSLRQSRIRAAGSRVRRRSLQIIRRRHARINEPCLFFNRFGKCNAGHTCRYIHDPTKVAVCRKFLRGICEDDSCTLRHEVDPNIMPVCFRFLRGVCTKDPCPYRHVKVNADAPICTQFLKGYCPEGDTCSKKHIWQCDAFAMDGHCPQGSKCPLSRTHSVRAARHPPGHDELERSLSSCSSEDLFDDDDDEDDDTFWSFLGPLSTGEGLGLKNDDDDEEEEEDDDPSDDSDDGGTVSGGSDDKDSRDRSPSHDDVRPTSPLPKRRRLSKSQDGIPGDIV